MITDKKISEIQKKLKAAIAEIEKEENVKISFGTCRYNSAFYNTTMKVETTVKTDRVDSVYEDICKKFGFTQNIVGMKFYGKNGLYEIVNILPRSRKYPVIAKSPNGKEFKYSVSHIKTLIGGDKIINRNANLDKLVK
jgi:hypothetical protein